jgi:hypothetical protein
MQSLDKQLKNNLAWESRLRSIVKNMKDEIVVLRNKAKPKSVSDIFNE